LSRRAAALAAADDRETAALRAELEADILSLGGGAEGQEDDEEDEQEGGALAGAFGSDIDSPLVAGGRRRSSASASGAEDLSLLRQRFGQTRIS
jgi:hypothetical protein